MIELLTGNLAEKSTEILKIGFSIWVGFNVTLIITFLLLRINKRDTQVVEMHLQIINAMAAIIIFSLLSYNIISQ